MIRIEKDKNLRAMNTFRMDVSCACFVEYDTPDDLSELDFSSLQQPVKHIGRGSNLLFLEDFPGTILHSDIRYIRESGSNEDEILIEVGAGTIFDDFVDWSCSMGLWGAENLSKIPGETGAAAVQNIGAYGVEVKDIIVRVTCYDCIKKDMVVFENSDCHYGYRDSFFKSEAPKGRYIVVSVLFRLSKEPAPRLEYGNVRKLLDTDEGSLSPNDVRRVITALRESKLPDPEITGSAGSFFKNPVISKEQFKKIEDAFISEKGPEEKVPHFETDGGIKVPAAWMIDQCGLKGMEIGGAAVHSRQPLVIINKSGDAKPQDVLTLEEKIMETVKSKFGVELHPEVEHIQAN